MARLGEAYDGDDFYCDVAIPQAAELDVVHEDERVLAYHHTKPYWSVHVVVVPKRHLASLTTLAAADERDVRALLAVVQAVAREVEGEHGEAGVLTNLGAYQDSKHLHVHVRAGPRRPTEPKAHEELYGRWAQRTPADVARLLDGYAGTWWVAGGWALEAFTGVTREHDDIDPSVLRAELSLLRGHLVGRLHVWAAASGALSPLLPDLDPNGAADAVLPDGCHQVWTRPSALDPWEYDVLLSDGTADEWVYRRDPSLRMPMAEALWERDGVRYLQPEIQLLFKAPGLRAKDQTDFDATLPHLDRRRRAWLRDALAATVPDHPWTGALTS